MGIEYKKIRVTASYDYNINQIGNDVSNANNNIPNTFELSMNYILKTNKGKEYEDCFIFNPRF